MVEMERMVATPELMCLGNGGMSVQRKPGVCYSSIH